MKKLFALLMAAVMAVGLAATASAAPLTLPEQGEPEVNVGNTDLKYGDDPLTFYLEAGDVGFTTGESKDGYDAFRNTGDYSLSVSASSNHDDIKAEYKLYKNADRDAAAIKIVITPVKEKFTVADEAEWKVKVKLVQKDKDAGESVTGELLVTGTIDNTRAYYSDAYTDASGNYVLDTTARVVDVSVFEDAQGSGLAIYYPKYAIKFKKISRQNTSLYLHAKTDVVNVEKSKAIGSVGFKATKLKDAAVITMPISADNENYYGETVYVYKVVDGKPTGTPIVADVVNHSYVVFNVPSSTTLGTYAAYGSKAYGDEEAKPEKPAASAEKPAIPETGF